MPWKTSETWKASELPMTCCWLRASTTASVDSPSCTVTTTWGPGGPSAWASSSYQSTKARTMHEQAAADAGNDPAAAAHPGRAGGSPPARLSGRPSSGVLVVWLGFGVGLGRAVGARRCGHGSCGSPALLAGVGVVTVEGLGRPAHALSSQACSSTMAAALSTTLRAAFPVRPAARRERSASTVVKRSSAVSTADPERLEQRPQRRRLVEGRPGRRPDLAREAQRAARRRRSTPPPRARRPPRPCGPVAGSPLRSIVPQGLARVRPLSL